MKSLEFGAWQPVKSLDYNGFYLPFAKFFFVLIKICDVFKPVFINPVRLSTTSCQYTIKL